MKRKSFKKLMGLLLCTAMTAGLLAGCGQGGQSAKEDSSPADTGAEVEEETDTTADAGTDEEIPTYTITMMRWSEEWSLDFLKTGVLKELEEKHGINIDWDIRYNSDWGEQKSLLLASGDYPDAFMGYGALSASDISQNKSMFLELTDLINEENMPNLTRIFKEDPNMKAVCTERDGTIYSLPKQSGIYPEVLGDSFYINQEWLDNLGLDMPKTYEELADVLEKFVTEDADGDGDPTNEIGYSNFAGNVLLLDLRSFLAPFATMISREGNYMGLNGDGDPVFMPVQENYKEAVKWMHDLWQRGVLDPEYFTQDYSMFKSKLNAEGGASVGLVRGWTADAEVGTNAGQFVPLEAVEGPDGGHYVECGSPYGDRGMVISKSCPNPEKLLAWADDFYDNLVSLQNLFGSVSEGLIIDNGDGTYTIPAPDDGTSLDTSAWNNSLREFCPGYITREFAANVILPDDQGDGAKIKEDAVNGKYVTKDHNTGFPTVRYTEEEQSQMVTLQQDIHKYCEVQYAHWVTEGGIDEEWDDYLKQLDAMGLQDLIQIYEGAYAAYKETMN